MRDRHEEIDPFLRLLEVRAWDAVFSRNGERVVLEIDAKENAE